MKALNQFLVIFTAILAIVVPVSTDEVSVETGSISEVELSVSAESNMWTGLYGEAGGGVGVGAGNDTLFNWEATEARYVYLDEDGIDFEANWSAANSSDLASEYGFLSGVESSSNTFRSKANLTPTMQEDSVLNTVAAETRNGSGSYHWKTAYVRQNSSDGFFVGVVDNGTAFNGNEADFQVLLPEKPFDSKPTTYNMWVELEPK